MKKLLMLMVVVGIVISASAQSPVQVTVQRITKKKSAQGEVTKEGGIRWHGYDTASASVTLRITVLNTSAQPIENVIVRWGVAKVQLSGSDRAGNAAYGKDEKCSLRPKETKVIETETVEAKKQESQLSDRTFGEKIRGHGVQVLIGGRTVWEEFVPPAIKTSFENLKPLSEQDKEGSQEKPKKKKK